MTRRVAVSSTLPSAICQHYFSSLALVIPTTQLAIDLTEEHSHLAAPQGYELLVS